MDITRREAIKAGAALAALGKVPEELPVESLLTPQLAPTSAPTKPGFFEGEVWILVSFDPAEFTPEKIAERFPETIDDNIGVKA